LEAAAALGVADSTVKSHLERIFGKTGTRDQVELVRLVVTLSSPAGKVQLSSNGCGSRLPPR
jgi:Bacterial regulatory proteins, luxR family